MRGIPDGAKLLIGGQIQHNFNIDMIFLFCLGVHALNYLHLNILINCKKQIELRTVV